jgi:hypothetical protein
MKELAKQIEKLAAQAMQKSNSATSKTVVETGKRHVQTDVYDVYTPDPSNPRSYKRTGELKESWEAEETPDGIAVFNNREDDGRDVAYIVHSGQGYQYDFEYAGKERPFVDNTADELKKGNQLKDSLKKDLKSIGLDVE